jgi:hypothetical protein
MKIFALLLAATFVALPSAFAQPVETPAGRSATPAGASPAASLVDAEAWLARQASILSIRSRDYDPFGRLKDPSMAPPAPPPSEELIEDLPVPGETVPEVDLKAEFAKAVAAIEVTMSGRGQFVTQGRTFRQGQSLVLAIDGRQFEATIKAVSPTLIVFDNPKLGARAEIRRPTLPAGMSGSAPATTTLAPGITRRQNPASPVLELGNKQ